MKKIFLDESIFIGIFSGIRNNDVKYINLCKKIMLLTEQKRIRLYYSYYHIYRTASQYQSEEKILEKLEDVKLLTDSNCIVLENNSCAGRKLDPVKQYLTMQPVFSFIQHNTELISKYFDIRTMWPFNTDPVTRRGMPGSFNLAILEQERKKILLFDREAENKHELKHITVRLKQNITLFFKEFLNNFTEQYVYLFSHDAHELIRNNIVKMQTNIFSRIENHKALLYTMQISYILGEMERLIEKIHTTEQLMPQFVRINRSGHLYNSPGDGPANYQQNYSLLNIAFNVDPDNICDIFVYDRSLDNSSDEIVDLVLDNKNLLVQNSTEFIDYINNIL